MRPVPPVGAHPSRHRLHDQLDGFQQQFLRLVHTGQRLAEGEGVAACTGGRRGVLLLFHADALQLLNRAVQVRILIQ